MPSYVYVVMIRSQEGSVNLHAICTIDQTIHDMFFEFFVPNSKPFVPDSKL